MISKELYETVNKQKYGDRHFRSLIIPVDSFFFKCIDFISDSGYVFVQDNRGYLRIKKLGDDKMFKIWEDECYNKDRLFDACQWILDNKDK